MNIIRDYLVELAKYLPEFLRRDTEMSTILEVESIEHRVQVDALKDLVNQLFIDTATWGLANYERNLGISPQADDDFAQRRNRIYLKLQFKQTSTKEFMRKLAARYFSDDAVIEAREDNPNDMFWIINHGGSLLYFWDLIDAIDTYIPAHLGFGLHIERETDATPYIGGCMIQHKKFVVGMAAPKGGNAEAVPYIGGRTYTHRRYSVANARPKESNAYMVNRIAGRESMHKKYTV